MFNKSKHIVPIVGLIFVFGVLLTLATCFDLQLSHFMAGGGLVSSRYFSTRIVCNIVEIIGAAPIWSAGAFAAGVLTVYFNEKSGCIRHLRVLFFLLSALVSGLLVRDAMKYGFQIMEREELLHAPLATVGFLGFGLVAATLLMVFGYKSIRKNMKVLLPFALAIICACCCFLIIELIKNPMGRMRYRAMHLLGDYSYFTPWYQVSQARELLGGNMPKDYFKSFPSGHTFSASMSYLMIMFPDLFERWQTGKRRLCAYLIPVCYTGFVAFFRIAAGAHYLSDVLVGGTIGYLVVQLFRYIFLHRCKQGE